MKKFTILKDFFVILLISFAIIIFIEFFVRFFIYKEKTAENMHAFVMPDKELIWKLDPDQGKKYFNGAFKTNEIGFRDNSYKKNAEIKILILGDSVSWGHDIFDYNLTYTYILEKFIEKRKKIKVDVINASVPGYSTFQQLIYLKNNGINLKPDIIVLQFTLNDVFERYNSLAQYGGDNFFLGIDTREYIKGMNGLLIRHSYLYELTMKKMVKFSKKIENYKVNSLFVDNPSFEIIDAWNTTLSEIDEIHEIAKLNNIPFVVMIVPYKVQINNVNLNKPQTIIRNHAINKNFKVLDLLPVFQLSHKENPNVPLFVDENHMSRTGHFITAVSLNDFLNKL